MANLGTFALLVGFVLALYAIGTFLIGVKNDNQRLIASAKGAVVSLAVSLTVASAALFYALGTSDFSLKYVAEYTSRDLDTLYKYMAFWAGQAGSLLLWVWFLAALSAIVVYIPFPGSRQQIPVIGSVLMGISLFFLFILNFVTSPFTTISPVPADGSGLNPLLQNPGMFIHPLTLYIGYVGFSVPFAFAIAALITKKLDDTWIRETRRWTLCAWLFLSIGIIYGAQWAYVELGWGGYWGWDPVENASLMPWLVGTAFLHSVMIQERKGMLKIWNVGLIIATFLLSIFGTFLTRSGILSSVHAFNDSTLGTWFLIFLATTFAASLLLFVDRVPLLRSKSSFESYVSRESSFLFNNLLLVGMAFTVLWGTVYPLISEAVTGQKVTVGPPFFNQVMVPLGLALIILAGICPLIAWRKSSWKNLRENFLIPFSAGVAAAALLALLGIRNAGALFSFGTVGFVAASIALEIYRGVQVRRKMTGESVPVAWGRLFTKNRRRYGGYLVHTAILLIVIAITGEGVFHQEITKSVKPGESIALGGYTFAYDGLFEKNEPGKTRVYADLRVYRGSGQEGGVKAGERKELGVLRPEKVFYDKFEQPSSEVAILGGLDKDLYVILAGWDRDGTTTFKVVINPLMAWMWIGEYLLVLATLFAMWPSRREREAKKRLILAEAGGIQS